MSESVCLSGTLSMGRAAFTKLIKAETDFTVCSSVNNSTDYLVSTDAEYKKDTAKIKSAKAKGIPIVSEDWVDASITAGVAAKPEKFLIGDGPSSSKPAPTKKVPAKRAPAKKAVPAKKNTGGGNLSGLVVCLSGTLSQTRPKLTTIYKEHGCVVKASITKDVMALVSEESDENAKISKCINNDIPIVTEEFMDCSMEDGKFMERFRMFRFRNAAHCGDLDKEKEMEEDVEEEEEEGTDSEEIEEEEEKEFNDENCLEGVKMCLSGTLSDTRPKLSKLYKSYGATIKTSVTKDLTFLLSEETDYTGKIAKCEDYEIPVVTEAGIDAVLAGDYTVDEMILDNGFRNGNFPDLIKYVTTEDVPASPPKKRVVKKEPAPPAAVSAVRPKKSKPLSGVIVCMSGPLSSTRTVLTKQWSNLGANVKNSITKDLMVLVTEEQYPNSKILKALSMDIPIVHEGFIHEMIDEGKSFDECINMASLRNPQSPIAGDDDGSAADVNDSNDADMDALVMPIEIPDGDRLQGLVVLVINDSGRMEGEMKESNAKICKSVTMKCNLVMIDQNIDANLWSATEMKHVKKALDNGLPFVNSDFTYCADVGRWTVDDVREHCINTKVEEEVNLFIRLGSVPEPKQSRKRTATTCKKEPALKKSRPAGSKGDGKRKVIMKGYAPLDPFLPAHLECCHVYDEGPNNVWDCMLNQTNLSSNNNKFYVIQLLSDGNNYYTFTRWGRVGVKGQQMTAGPGDLQTCKDAFEKKFYTKTKNHWEDRDDFVSYARKYTLLKMDYSDNTVDAPEKMKVEVPDSKLDERVQELMKLICDLDMMKSQMVEIGYDCEKLPLGKLDKSTLDKGYAVLQTISDVLDNNIHGSLSQLSGDFYSLIPHNFGFAKMSQFIINDHIKVGKKIELLDSLADIQIATELLKNPTQGNVIENPIDHNYDKLNCKIERMEESNDEDSEILDNIKDYVKNTHGSTHKQFKLKIEDVFRVEREGDTEKFEKFSTSIDNHALLWHGSRLTNYVGILSQGLRIAPPEAPVTGYMFGKGVYFADMVSKSANYCRTNKNNNTGLLLLCEVALGKCQTRLEADYDADKMDPLCMSTHGVGANAPSGSNVIELDGNEVSIPNQPHKSNPDHKGSLLYNEFIVYNTAQVRPRYLVRCDFEYKRR
eukprot:TRINITY_DN44947_c0_g1_i4.p1 TRINITY_DN44947_c0_g1~~TRINITY_DN44947_c0_g1_i4.p1  ORF type:complete len:1169 (-),score=438.26 TRINITY_DN44947_c0_g1_i4:173-3643(-)